MNEHERDEKTGSGCCSDRTEQVLVGDLLGYAGEPLRRMKLELGAAACFRASFLLAVPGEEIDLNHNIGARGSVLTEGEANREHEERRDLIGHE